MVFVVSRISAPAAPSGQNTPRPPATAPRATPLGPEFPGARRTPPGARNLADFPAKTPVTAPAAPSGQNNPRRPGIRRHPRSRRLRRAPNGM